MAGTEPVDESQLRRFATGCSLGFVKCPHWARPADEWIRRLAPVSEDLDARGAAFISNCFDEISVVLDAPREVQLRGLEAVLTAAADQRDRVKLTDPANADLITATLRAEVFVRPYLAWLLEGEGRCEDAVRTMLPVLMATAILISLYSWASSRANSWSSTPSTGSSKSYRIVVPRRRCWRRTTSCARRRGIELATPRGPWKSCRARPSFQMNFLTAYEKRLRMPPGF
jgi:hypothetical protein